MGSSDKKTDSSIDDGDTHESSVAEREAESRGEEVTGSESIDGTPDTIDGTAENPADSDPQSWGYEEKKRRFSKEIAIALVAILLLVGVFGFVVWRSMKSKVPGEEELVAQTGEKPSAAEIEPSNPTPPPETDDTAQATLTTNTTQLPTQQPEPISDTTASTDTPLPTFASEAVTTQTNPTEELATANGSPTGNPFTEPLASSEPRMQENSANTNSANEFSPFGDTSSANPEPKDAKPDPFASSPATEFGNSKSTEFSPPNVVAETFPPQPMPQLESAIVKTADELVPMPAETIQPAVLPMQEPQPFSPGRAPLEINSNPPRSYVVKEGDNFWEISKKVYGQHSLFLALFEFNRSRVPNADLLIPGTELLTPDVNQLEEIANQLALSSRAAKTNSSVSTANTTIVRRPETPLAVRESGIFYRETDGQPIYRVGKNDSLSRIALQHLGRSERWRQIYNMNQDQLKSEKHLRPGVELRLPADASRVALTDDTTFRR